MSKISSKGSVLKKSISNSFTTIAQVDTIQAPPGAVEFMDVTDLSSSAGREKLPSGFVDTGECTIGGFFDPVAATHKSLTTDITTPTAASSYKIVWSDAANTEWAFTGGVSKFQPQASVGQPLRFDASVMATGLVTYPT